MYIIASSFYSAVQLKFTSTHFLESQQGMRKNILLKEVVSPHLVSFITRRKTIFNWREFKKCHLNKTDKNKRNENKSEINKNS